MTPKARIIKRLLVEVSIITDFSLCFKYIFKLFFIFKLQIVFHFEIKMVPGPFPGGPAPGVRISAKHITIIIPGPSFINIITAYNADSFIIQIAL